MLEKPIPALHDVCVMKYLQFFLHLFENVKQIVDVMEQQPTCKRFAAKWRDKLLEGKVRENLYRESVATAKVSTLHTFIKYDVAIELDYSGRRNNSR